MSDYYGYHSYDNRLRPPTLIIVGIVLVVIAIVCIVPLYHSYKRVSTATVTVCDKESVDTGDGNHEYRVYTSAGTYVVKDHIVNGARFTSADTYGKLQRNTVYQIKSYGWRIGFFSSFKNILEATKVPDAKPSGCDG